MIINPIIYDSRRTSDIYSINLEHRIIYLIGEITEETAAATIAQLHYLASVSDEDIHLYINSPGGSVDAGMAIYDTMNSIKPNVCTYVMGIAASMGAFLLAGGSRGKRYALPNAEVMIHQPLGGAHGQATDIQIAAKHISMIKERINRLLSKNTGQTYETILADTERDNWKSAKEAMEYGLVDEVINEKGDITIW